MNGILNLYKPIGYTSHDMVNIIRRIFNTRKVGHGGTLDPGVSGVLPICIGKGTRIAEYLLDDDKEYIGEITFGISTTTMDRFGDVVRKGPADIKEKDIISVFKSFRGEINQTPPMFSAVRVKGKRLHDLAREGKDIERKSRKIKIYSNEILSINENRVLFKVRCSKGTYIRSYCYEIGKALGTEAYMSYLTRTSSGVFEIEDSISLDFIKNINGKDLSKVLFPIDYPIKNFKALQLDLKETEKFINGQRLRIDKSFFDDNELIRVYFKESFLGIGQYKKKDKLLSIKKMLKV